jgi:lysophospholipase L1-like esterase
MKIHGQICIVSMLLSVLNVAAQQNNLPVKSSSECVRIKRKLEQATNKMQDWANLQHYREANRSVSTLAKGEQRVVFLGDSITSDWSRREAGGFFPGEPYINRGIGGQTTAQMLIRMRPDVIALQARVVVILAGTNDLAGNTGPMTLEEIEGNLASMAELASANGIHVVLCSVLPVYDAEHSTDANARINIERHPPEKILALNAWINRYAVERGHVYLDYFAAVVDEKGLLRRDSSDDGVHPNAKGYAAMSPLAEAAIRIASRE